MAKSIKHPLDRPSRKYVAVFTLLIVVISLPWFFPYQYYRYVKCGREPVKVVSRDFSNETLNYVIPEDSSYKDMILVNGYYCSENDAKRDGLKNLYNEDGRLNPESTLRR